MRIRHAKLVTALLTTTAIGLGAIEIPANLAARGELNRLLARSPGLSVASLFAEPLTGRVVLHGLKVGHGDTRVTVGRLDLPLSGRFDLITAAAASPFDDKPAEAAKPDEAPAALGTGTASADNITISSGTTTYRIKHIDVTGTSLTNADLAKLFDANGAETLEARLKALTATAIVVPEILADDTTAGSERHATLTQVILSGATAGKIAAISVGGVTFAVKDGEDESTGSVGAIQASGTDLPQIVHVFSSVRSSDAEPILPLYDSVTLTSLKVADAKKNGTFTLATLKEAGVRARPLKTDYISAKKAGAEPLTEAQKSAVYQDMSQSFEIGALEATDLAGQGGQSGSIKLASVALRDFAQNRVGGLSIRALRFEGPDATFGVASVDVGPFMLPPSKDAVVSAQAASTMMPSAAKIDVGQIDFDGKADGTDVAGAPNRMKFTVAHAGFVSDGEPGDLPKTAKMTVDNVTFDVPPVSGQAQPIYDMGYHHLDVSMGLSTIYDSAAQSLMIHDLTLNGVSMGSLALGLHLVNVTKGLVSSNPEIVKASALAILARGVTLDLVNEGLIDKALEWKAKQDGIDVAKEKEFLIDFFDTKLPASLNNSANVKIIGSAVAKFVAAPKTLHVGIESKSGLGIGSMALLSDPGLLIDSLDVKATANQ